MGENSNIQWTDATWNPWTGCRKVSPGCKFCYMYRGKERFGLDGNQVIRGKSTFKNPLKWKEPKLIFTCSWSDFFIEDADGWRDEAWDIIRSTPHHTYQILTKRPERIVQCLPPDWGDGYDNVWLGVSAEDQFRYEDRARQLVEIPARVRFISFEPLLGLITLDQSIFGIHWAIIGGESGNEVGRYRYRPCELDWIYSLVRECQRMDIPVFVKQMGTHLAKELEIDHRHGGDITEWPRSLRIRQFPKSYAHEGIYG